MIGETILICGFCVSAGLGIEDVIKKKIQSLTLKNSQPDGGSKEHT